MDQVLQFFGGVLVYGAAAGAVALGLFKVFGERLINHRFDKALATFKDEQVQEMEHLRYQISGLLDRTTKLNEMEFKVVPEAWGKVLAAYNQAKFQTSSGRLVQHLDDMDLETLEDFLTLSPLLVAKEQGKVSHEGSDARLLRYRVLPCQGSRRSGSSRDVHPPTGARHLPAV